MHVSLQEVLCDLSEALQAHNLGVVQVGQNSFFLNGSLGCSSMSLLLLLCRTLLMQCMAALLSYGAVQDVLHDWSCKRTAGIAMISVLSVQSQNGSMGNGQNMSRSAPENVQSARQWIAEWRAEQKEEPVLARK